MVVELCEIIFLTLSKVDQPIINHLLLMTEHLFVSSSYVLHFTLSDLKCYGVLTQALEILFEVQRKKINEKTTRRKISFPTYKMHFFIFYFFEPLLLSNVIIYLFIINRFKVLQEHRLKF
jgi:hypothetical protein